MLLDLALLALAACQRNINLIIGLLVLDVLMIQTGLQVGSSISEFSRGIWFIFSTIVMIVLVYLVYTRLFAKAAKIVFGFFLPTNWQMSGEAAGEGAGPTSRIR